MLAQLARAGHIKVTGRVVGELTGPGAEGKDPELAGWVSKHRNEIEIPDDQVPDEVLAEIIRKYPGLARGRRGLSAADPQFVAALKHFSETSPGLVGVSDDDRIRRACESENLTCIRWDEFARRETGHAP